MKRVSFLYALLALTIILRYFWFSHIMPSPLHTIQKEGERLVLFLRDIPEGARVTVFENSIRVFTDNALQGQHQVSSSCTPHPQGESVFYRKEMVMDLVGEEARGSLFYSLQNGKLDFIGTQKRARRY